MMGPTITHPPLEIITKCVLYSTATSHTARSATEVFSCAFKIEINTIHLKYNVAAD